MVPTGRSIGVGNGKPAGTSTSTHLQVGWQDRSPAPCALPLRDKGVGFATERSIVFTASVLAGLKILNPDRGIHL